MVEVGSRVDLIRKMSLKLLKNACLTISTKFFEISAKFFEIFRIQNILRPVPCPQQKAVQ